MIAVDTNILVYAHRQDASWHTPAKKCMTELCEGSSPWLLPWSVINEFLAIVTHPRIYNPPTPLDRAITQVDYWLESPSVVIASEPDTFWTNYRDLLNNTRVIGPQIHDARIAAICIEHAVEVLLSADRDFSRFAKLKVRNPLV